MMNQKRLSGSHLKLIAITAMVIDHFGKIIVQDAMIMQAPYYFFTDQQVKYLFIINTICRLVGRLAFPIFCFLLVEGFCYTKHLTKYFLSLLGFALLTEPFYDWALTGQFVSWQGQNVLFTLLIGLLTLTIIKQANNHPLVSLVTCFVSSLITYQFRCDGWYYGILMITVFYLLRDRNCLKYLGIVGVIYLCGLDFSLQGLRDPYFLMSVASLLLIACYNQQRGGNLKYFFYIFYPAHLLVLKLLADGLVQFF